MHPVQEIESNFDVSHGAAAHQPCWSRRWQRKREEDVVFPNAAGIDVGASSHWVAVPKHLADEPVREFGAMTDDLNALADWLLACGVDTVALESTGVYWIPIYEVLEQRGLKVWLVDARQMKYVPGRKSDVQDRQWLQRLMSLGLLRAAWRPGDEVCVVRAVVRQRDVLLVEQGTWLQRMQKAFVGLLRNNSASAALRRSSVGPRPLDSKSPCRRNCMNALDSGLFLERTVHDARPRVRPYCAGVAAQPASASHEARGPTSSTVSFDKGPR